MMMCYIFLHFFSKTLRGSRHAKTNGFNMMAKSTFPEYTVITSCTMVSSSSSSIAKCDENAGC